MSDCSFHDYPIFREQANVIRGLLYLGTGCDHGGAEVTQCSPGPLQPYR